MATRCNILLLFGDSKVWIYRHWDGYPAVTGLDLAQRLATHMIDNKVLAGDSRLYLRPTDFLTGLLTAKRDGGDPLPQYELTSCRHGDIEWQYTVRFSQGADRLELHVQKIPIGSDRDLVDVLNFKWMGLPEFKAFCEEEHGRMMKRYAARGLVSPG